MTVWREVEDALEAIIRDYEKVNHVISLYQDDRARLRGLERMGPQQGVVVELGCGPGNFTRMLRQRAEGFIVCLDYSVRMIPVARARNGNGDIGFVRGIFEALPFRRNTASFANAAFALRDSTDKFRTLVEVRQTLREGGKLLVVDIGKPDNNVVRGFFTLFMRFIVPILGGLKAGYGFRNPWSLLHETYRLLPMNRRLFLLLRRILGRSELEELALGCLVVAVAEKGPDNDDDPSRF